MKRLLRMLMACACGCSPPQRGAADGRRTGRRIVRVTGSDTMVKLVQAYDPRLGSDASRPQ